MFQLGGQPEQIKILLTNWYLKEQTRHNSRCDMAALQHLHDSAQCTDSLNNSSHEYLRALLLIAFALCTDGVYIASAIQTQILVAPAKAEAIFTYSHRPWKYSTPALAGVTDGSCCSKVFTLVFQSRNQRDFMCSVYYSVYCSPLKGPSTVSGSDQKAPHTLGSST